MAVCCAPDRDELSGQVGWVRDSKGSAGRPTASGNSSQCSHAVFASPPKATTASMGLESRIALIQRFR